VIGRLNRLNSSLSVRIEELNSQISILYTENLRLRASEISLSNQLKQEREKSRKLIDEVESAVRLSLPTLVLSFFTDCAFFFYCFLAGD
jgi:hypothetical protein